MYQLYKFPITTESTLKLIDIRRSFGGSYDHNKRACWRIQFGRKRIRHTPTIRIDCKIYNLISHYSVCYYEYDLIMHTPVWNTDPGSCNRRDRVNNRLYGCWTNKPVQMEYCPDNCNPYCKIRLIRTYIHIEQRKTLVSFFWW